MLPTDEFRFLLVLEADDQTCSGGQCCGFLASHTTILHAARHNMRMLLAASHVAMQALLQFIDNLLKTIKETVVFWWWSSYLCQVLLATVLERFKMFLKRKGFRTWNMEQQWQLHQHKILSSQSGTNVLPACVRLVDRRFQAESFVECAAGTMMTLTRQYQQPDLFCYVMNCDRKVKLTSLVMLT